MFVYTLISFYFSFQVCKNRTKDIKHLQYKQFKHEIKILEAMQQSAYDQLRFHRFAEQFYVCLIFNSIHENSLASKHQVKPFAILTFHCNVDIKRTMELCRALISLIFYPQDICYHHTLATATQSKRAWNDNEEILSKTTKTFRAHHFHHGK